MCLSFCHEKRGLIDMYDTIIFDLDGTLLNTLDDLCDSTNYALAIHGFPTRSIAEVRRFVGNGIRKLIERAVPENASPEQIEAVFADFKKHYDIHCNDKTGPYGGVIELLRELKGRGYKLGIASNKVKSAVEKLNDIYFEGLIDSAAGVADGKPTKPDPYMIEVMLEELGSTKDSTLYVGDSQVDVQTAANTGLDMVTVLWGFRDRDELEAAGAVRFIDKPMELLGYI